jgi:hypothetical protein
MTSFKKFIESFDKEIKIPPRPGTAPIPPGYIRLYHQTSHENVDSIRKNGLQKSHSRGKDLKEPIVIWASTEPYYGNIEGTATIEFSIPREQFRLPYYVLRDNILPEEIIAIHEGWHDLARDWIEEYPNPNKLFDSQITSIEFLRQTAEQIGGDYQKAFDAYARYVGSF